MIAIVTPPLDLGTWTHGPRTLQPRTERAGPGVLSAVGGTPLVELSQLIPGAGFRLLAKLEGLNPGGSIKDRPAVAILQEGIRSAAIREDTVIVEQSSGNMGIGLAQACRYFGLRFICVIDPKTTAQTAAILRAYGAQLDVVTEPDPDTGEYLPAKMRRVQGLVAELCNAFWPNQYENVSNPGSHFRTTMHEIVTALDGELDYLLVPTSTCGTLRGCGEYVRAHELRTKVIAVDAVGSRIFHDERARRLIPGLGAGIKPPFCEPALIDGCVHVTNIDCVVGCRRLVRREAILAGGSSGAVATAVDRMKAEVPTGATCVLILPDRGERYLETIYSDAWVQEHFGSVEHLWQDGER